MWLKSLTNLMKICESVRSHNMPLSFIDQRAVHCADFFETMRISFKSELKAQTHSADFSRWVSSVVALFC